MEEPTRNDVFGLGGTASDIAAVEEESQWLRQHFALPFNPFPQSGISPEAPDGPPLPDEKGQEIDSQIGRFIMSAFKDRVSTKGLAVIGSYGTGKSHLLRLMHKEITQWLGSGEEKALSIYIQRPRIEAQDVNREILKSLGEDTFRKMLWFSLRDTIAADAEASSDRLRELRQELQGPLFTNIGDDEFTDVFGPSNLEDYRTFLAAFDALGLRREALLPYLTEVFVRAVAPTSPLEVAQGCVTLLLSRDDKARASWESLLALGKTRRVPLLAAPDFLEDLLSVFKMNGYVYTFLLIDEFEEVPSGYLLTRRQKADYMYTMMEVLNRIQKGLCLVLAITPEAWQNLTEVAPPLQDRIPTTIRLATLGKNSIIRLLQFYLGQARKDGKIEIEDHLFPFSEATVNQIHSSLPARTPRNILQFSYQVISYCFSNSITAITPETIKTVLKDFMAMKSVEAPKRRLDRS